VCIEVQDSGLGMDEAQLAHLFEPFNRLGAEREGVEGTGIGLAIVKALVERMGGSVQVHSRLGEGSVFQVRLADGAGALASAQAAGVVACETTGEAACGTAHTADAGGPIHSRPATAPGLGARPARVPAPGANGQAAAPPRGRLLYIEDNPVNALIIAELIGRRPDLQLHLAADGVGGVREAQWLQPDLVLLDMQLPDIDGHEVLRRLRAEPSTAHIPVIALSANAMPDDIDRALQAGISDYWTKPLDFRAFMASIEALFGPAPS
jgi:CheY-like chemotaxis protein